MTWKKHFRPYKTNSNGNSNNGGIGTEKNIPAYQGSSVGNYNYESYLPYVYSGAPNRLDRYSQYDHMDLDSHVSASLDSIAEFSTQATSETQLPFEINISSLTNLSENDMQILDTKLKQWNKLNKFESKLFEIFRNAIKYGDQFFIKDPETSEWLSVFHTNVLSVLVDESQGKKKEVYNIKELDYNSEGLLATDIPQNNFNGSQMVTNGRSTQTGKNGESFASAPVRAEHVVHLSMNNGLQPNWPFGTSELERIFKTYKQKELLEDSILIYRIQRAPERRVFYVDVGDMPQKKAMQFVDRIKNEIRQRRIPSKTGGGDNVTDATYNPVSVLEDFYFPQRADGRGSKVETLPGGDPTWGIEELKYFDNKMARGLRVPSSYLPTGPEDGSTPYSDGRVGTALIQELNFSKYCERLQKTLIGVFDNEFKLYLKKNDINIGAQNFSLKFTEAQNFAVWSKIDIDASKINNFTSVASSSFISKRMAMKEYLGWTESQIKENEKLVLEENPNKSKKIDSGDFGLGGDISTRDMDIRPNDIEKEYNSESLSDNDLEQSQEDNTDNSSLEDSI